jgi:phytoene desaturase
MEGKEVRQKLKAVVAGGGLGGLAAALRLRAAGWEVTVCDNGPTPGGKMNRWSTRGYVFDTGPTLLTMPHVLGRLFDALGERIGDYLELEPLDPHAEYIYPDGSRIRVPARAEDWLAAVREIAPADAEGARGLHELGERIYRLSEGTFFRHHPLLPLEAPEAGSLRHFPLRHAWGNYAGPWLRFIKIRSCAGSTTAIRPTWARLPTAARRLCW